MKYITVNGKESINYLADTKGNIYNKEGYKMTGHITHNGYERVKLSRDIPRGMYLVHRIIAETYLDNPNKYPVVDHKNNKRADNRLENLQWCTNSFNQKKRFQHHPPTTIRAVKQIELDTGKIVAKWESMTEAEKHTGIAKQNISKVCRKKRKHAGGYAWEYD